MLALDLSGVPVPELLQGGRVSMFLTVIGFGPGSTHMVGEVGLELRRLGQ